MSKLDASGHLNEEQLLRYVDGEADARETRYVRAHLESCWQCRTELENLQKTIGECVRYRKNALQVHLPPPPAPWGDLSYRFDEIDAARAEQNLLRRAFTAFEPLWTNSRSLITAVAGVILAIGLVQHFRDTPSVKAAELLRNAVSAAEKRSAPQRFIQFRTQNKRVTRRVPVQKVAKDELQPVIERLERANYDWQDPLSARSFSAWRDQLSDKDDFIETEDDCYRVRTTSDTGEVAEATLALRINDFQPVEGRLKFRNNEWVEITEVTDPPVVTDIAPAAPQPPVQPHPTPAPVEASAGDELQVLESLHRLGADLGEPIEVRRSGPNVVVTGSGLPSQRRQEIEKALEPLPHVSLQLESAQSAQTTPALDAPSVSVSPQRSDLQVKLEAFTGSRTHLESLASDVLSDTDQLMARIYALRNLAERFPPNVEASLRADQQKILQSLLREHAAALKSHATSVEYRMKPALTSLGASAGEPAASLPRAWQPATEVLFEKARKVEKALGSVLAGAPSDAPGELASDQVLRMILELRASSEDYGRVLNP